MANFIPRARRTARRLGWQSFRLLTACALIPCSLFGCTSNLVDELSGGEPDVEGDDTSPRVDASTEPEPGATDDTSGDDTSDDDTASDDTVNDDDTVDVDAGGDDTGDDDTSDDDTGGGLTDAPTDEPEPSTPPPDDDVDDDADVDDDDVDGDTDLPDAGDEPEPDPTEPLTLAETSPERDASDVDPAADVVLVFNQTVEPLEGLIRVSVATTTVEEMPLDDPRVTVNETTITIDLDTLLAGNTSHSVTVSEGAFTSPTGELSEEVAFAFTTASLEGPGGVASGLALWLDAEYEPSLKLDGDGVRLWADRSGNHKNAMQSEADARPVLGALTPGSETALEFDGVDDHLLSPAPMEGAGYDGFIVWQSDETPTQTSTSMLLASGNRFQITHGHAAPATRHALSAHAAGQWHFRRFAEPVADQVYLWNFSFNDVNQALSVRWQGGAPFFGITNPSAAPVAADAPLSLGANASGEFVFKGQVAEVILYARALGLEERLQIVEYLRAKWQIPEPNCRPSELLGPSGSCYFLSNATSALFWENARNTCRNRRPGWDLAHIQTATDNAFVASALSVATWIGGTSSGDRWHWANDQLEFWLGPSTVLNDAYVNWAEGQPSGTDTHCLRLTQNESWEAADCNTASPYLCEGPGD